MLFKRYANPMIILEQMIRTQRFSEFINEFVRIQNEELEDRTQWEFWLHRVFDKSWAQFLEVVEGNNSVAENMPTQDELEQTVMESKKIFSDFCLS